MREKEDCGGDGTLKECRVFSFGCGVWGKGRRRTLLIEDDRDASAFDDIDEVDVPKAC